MLKGLKSFLLALLMVTGASLVACDFARALEVEFALRSVKRDVLAVYDSRYEASPSETRIHRLAEMPLNWLGYKLTYVDVNSGLPPVEELDKYRAVVTWFIEPLTDTAPYVSWLDAATANGLRYICLGEPVPPEPPQDTDRVSRIMARIGLRQRDDFVSLTLKANITTLDPAMIGFERPVDKVLPPFRVVEQLSPLAKVHLAVSIPDGESELTSVLVATTPAGGYAADEYAFYYDAGVDKVRWILNPFAFFKEALGADLFPVPDVTTLDGRRMYFSHIDGDGWNNVSEIEGYRESQTSAAEVILRSVIAPYPDLPVSVGLIAGDTLPELGGMESARRTANKLFALPQVEVASHTYTHPFTWGFFDKYDRASELALIDQAAHPPLGAMDHLRNLLFRVAGRTGAETSQNRFVSGSADLPRSYMKEPFDAHKEVARALEITDSLAPPGKKTTIYQWSGDTEPFERIIRETRTAGIRNINGGDSRLDAEFPSVFYVPPIARPVGGERQIYAGNSNENTYTNNWRGPYYGQLMLKQTLDNTETPRRLKPIDLYYHMFSGEKSASVAAVKAFTDLARESEVIPVKTSEYAAIADDFFATDVLQVDALSWSIAHRGALQTLRFDVDDGLDLDMWKSTGVLGARRHQGSLYVALDPDTDPALVVLRHKENNDPPQSQPAEANAPPREPVRLVESRWQVRALHRETCGFAFEAHGFGPGDMTWLAVPGQAYDVAITRAHEALLGTQLTADAAGRLTAHFKVDALPLLQIRFACHGR